MLAAPAAIQEISFEKYWCINSRPISSSVAWLQRRRSNVVHLGKRSCNAILEYGMFLGTRRCSVWSCAHLQLLHTKRNLAHIDNRINSGYQCPFESLEPLSRPDTSTAWSISTGRFSQRNSSGDECWCSAPMYHIADDCNGRARRQRKVFHM